MWMDMSSKMIQKAGVAIINTYMVPIGSYSDSCGTNPPLVFLQAHWTSPSLSPRTELSNSPPVPPYLRPHRHLALPRTQYPDKVSDQIKILLRGTPYEPFWRQLDIWTTKCSASTSVELRSLWTHVLCHIVASNPDKIWASGVVPRCGKFRDGLDQWVTGYGEPAAKDLNC